MKNEHIYHNVLFRSENKEVTRALDMPDFFYMMSDGSIFHTKDGRSLSREMDLSALVGSDYDRLDHYEAECPMLDFFSREGSFFGDD